jgi:hypothetical protein
VLLLQMRLLLLEVVLVRLVVRVLLSVCVA